jgi:hypothetical protein
MRPAIIEATSNICPNIIEGNAGPYAELFEGHNLIIQIGFLTSTGYPAV